VIKLLTGWPEFGF